MAEVVETLRVPFLEADGNCAARYKLIQDKSEFCYGTDALLLAEFARLRHTDRVCDLCAGNGVIPLLLVAKKPGIQVAALEIQEHATDMARRSVELNGLGGCIHVFRADIRNAFDCVPKNSFTVVTCNPPYKKMSAQKRNPNPRKEIARHEVCCTFADVARVAAGLLNSTGRFYLVHRPDRIAEICATLSQHALEPKVVQFVHPNAEKNATMVLVEAVKCAEPGARVLPPLYVNA